MSRIEVVPSAILLPEEPSSLSVTGAPAAPEAPELAEEGVLSETEGKMEVVEDDSFINAKGVRVEKKKFKEYIILEDRYLVDEAFYNMLTISIRSRKNIMLLGPTGIGKTELIHYISKNLGLPLTILDMGTMADPVLGLIGTHVIKAEDGKTFSEFKQSRFSEVIQKPGIVLLDELSR